MSTTSEGLHPPPGLPSYFQHHIDAPASHVTRPSVHEATRISSHIYTAMLYLILLTLAQIRQKKADALQHGHSRCQCNEETVRKPSPLLFSPFLLLFPFSSPLNRHVPPLRPRLSFPFLHPPLFPISSCLGKYTYNTNFSRKKEATALS